MYASYVAAGPVPRDPLNRRHAGGPHRPAGAIIDRRHTVMHDMMGGMGAMMAGMGLLWLLVIVVLVLAAAALVKYLMSGKGGPR
jgi:hypothetical protein